MTRNSLITDMINISIIATHYKMNEQQSNLYFIDLNKENGIENQNIKGVDDLNALSILASINARRNRERI